MGPSVSVIVFCCCILKLAALNRQESQNIHILKEHNEYIYLLYLGLFELLCWSLGCCLFGCSSSGASAMGWSDVLWKWLEAGTPQPELAGTAGGAEEAIDTAFVTNHTTTQTNPASKRWAQWNQNSTHSYQRVRVEHFNHYTARQHQIASYYKQFKARFHYNKLFLWCNWFFLLVTMQPYQGCCAMVRNVRNRWSRTRFR